MSAAQVFACVRTRLIEFIRPLKSPHAIAAAVTEHVVEPAAVHAHEKGETARFGWFRNSLDGQRSPS
jgi:hypothetical protein